jgi:hypothetical protein
VGGQLRPSAAAFAFIFTACSSGSSITAHKESHPHGSSGFFAFVRALALDTGQMSEQALSNAFHGAAIGSCHPAGWSDDVFPTQNTTVALGCGGRGFEKSISQSPNRKNLR